MIIKIKSHKRPVFQKILAYMINDKDRLFDAEKKSFVVTHNLKGNTIDRWVNQFKENESFRKVKRSDSVFLTHEILSWHKEDSKNITLKKMEAMAYEYIRLRNQKGMYVAVPHFDKEHYHIHICASGIEFKTGKSLRLTKSEMQKLKVEIQNYQIEKFPELSKSIVEHDKKGRTTLSEKEYQIKLRTGRATQKEEVLMVLKSCYAKSNSRESFFELLKEKGLSTYERSGKITGVRNENFKFRFNRLGFSKEKFQELDKSNFRINALDDFRNNEFFKKIRKER
jgi:hypothetical protein